jgi:hypothetical protein
VPVQQQGALLSLARGIALLPGGKAIATERRPREKRRILWPYGNADVLALG